MCLELLESVKCPIKFKLCSKGSILEDSALAVACYIIVLMPGDFKSVCIKKGIMKACPLCVAVEQWFNWPVVLMRR